jgi:hypothetical protein
MIVYNLFISFYLEKGLENCKLLFILV